MFRSKYHSSSWLVNHRQQFLQCVCDHVLLLCFCLLRSLLNGLKSLDALDDNHSRNLYGSLEYFMLLMHTLELCAQGSLSYATSSLISPTMRFLPTLGRSLLQIPMLLETSMAFNPSTIRQQSSRSISVRRDLSHWFRVRKACIVGSYS